LKDELEVELELAIYAVSLLMVVGACRVVTLSAQLMRSLLAITKFLVVIIVVILPVPL